MLRFRGHLDTGAFFAALSRVDGAAECLRLRFVLVDQEPRQFLAPEPGRDFALLDLSLGDDPLAAALAEAQRLAARPFDLEKGPLHRHRLLRLGPEDHLWVRAYHHLVFDGFSARLELNHVAASYAALVRGLPLPTLDLPGYFSAWDGQEADRDSDGYRRAVEHWRDRLLQGGPLLAFSDAPLASPPGPASRLDRTLPDHQATDLSDLARALGISLPALLLAAYLLLLARESHNQHPACQLARLGRQGPRQRHVMGAFAQVVPFGLDLGGVQRFDALARQVADRLRGDHRHGRLTIPEMLQAGLDPWQGGPSWGAAFNALDFPYDPGFPGLSVSPTILSVGPVADVTLTVCAQQHRNGSGALTLSWLHNPDRVPASHAARLAGRYQALLAAVLAQPTAPLASLPVMPRAEEDLIAAWEQGPPAPPGCQEVPVHQAFWRKARATPQAPAVFAGRKRLDYAALAARAAGLALRLRTLGVDPETPVGLCLGSTVQMVVGFLGILAAGGAVLALEPTLPPARLGGMAQGVGCRVVVVQGRSRDRLPEDFLARATVVDLDQALPPAGPDFLPAGTQPSQLACILHTSGSTGRPKPVGVTHGALAAKIVTMLEYFGFGSSEVTCAAASIAFDPLLQQIFLPLTSGGAVWVPERTLLVDPPAFWRAAAARGVTHLNLVPSMLDALLEAAPPRPLPSIIRLVVGGERFAPELAARAAAILGTAAVWNMYGPTETTVDATGWRVDPADPGAELPIGRPLTGYQVRLLDADQRRTPLGHVGEICIGGMGLARGYLGRPEQTEASFPPDPYGPPGSRLYRSGDFARWREDGVLIFQGRRDDQVKLRGQRIELGEVEAVLRRQPGVNQAAVVKAPEGQDRGLVAYVAGTATARELALGLARELPRAAVPSRFVILPALPLLPSGKLDRQALPALETATAPASPPPRPTRSSQAGGGALRRAIAAIWAELLGRNEVDPEANLFEMGAHSLLVPRALVRINAVAGRELRAADLFRFPSVAALAAHLAGQDPKPERPAPAPAGPAVGPQPVAIIGLAFRFPGAEDRQTFWTNLTAGVCSVTAPDRAALLAEGAPPALLDDPGFRPQQGRLTGVDRFDPAPFGYTPGAVMEMDPQQRLLLETAWRALEDAGCDPATDGPVGVVAGVGFNAYLIDNLGPRLARGSLTDRYMLMLGNDKDHAATRLAYKLDLTGPALNLNTACSTGLAAVAEAVEHLRAGRARVMLAGGASLGIASHGGYLHAEGGIASPSGVCRPFDAAADGTVPGAGVGVVALKLLDQALADGDTIHAVIRGVGISNDGAARAAFTAPSVRGQVAALGMALAEAGVEPGDIGFVEGHGTGTALGDPIEAQALELAYGGESSPPGGILLGSVKGNLGHLDAAAGVAGLIKAVLALQAGQIPPTCHFASPNPRIAWETSPFRVSGRLEPWPPRPADHPRRAAVSSFGVGGVNVHLVLEEAPPAPPLVDEAGAGPCLLALSAADPPALAQLAQDLAQRLAAPDPPLLPVVAASLASRRRQTERLALVAADQREAIARLTQAETPGRARGARRGGAPTLALVFPGQGAQHPGMGRDLYQGEPVFRQVVDQACDLLAGSAATDLRSLILAPEEDPEAAARLAQTAVTQPALFTVEYGLARLLVRYGLEPEALAGHSVGEYVAACLAGVMDFPAALGLVVERGRLMGSAPAGAMLALAMPEDQALALVEQCGPGVCLAVVNSPRQCVAAGEAPAIARLEATAQALGRPAHRLAVSHAFHCHLMDPVLDRFRAAVARVELKPPRIACASNLSGGWLTPEQATDPDYWVAHLRGQVRFAANLGLLLSDPERVLVEAGPGQTLTRLALASGAEPGRAIATQPRPSPLDGRASLRLALGQLWTQGWEPDWTTLHGPRRRTPLPTYPFQRVRLWLDPERQEPSLVPTPPRVAAARETGSLDGEAPPARVSSRELLEAVIQVWREVFGRPEIGPDGDFLNLGGDSLLAVRLAARIKERLGRTVPVATIFELRTVQAVAMRLNGGGGGPASVPPGAGAGVQREEGLL